MTLGAGKKATKETQLTVVVGIADLACDRWGEEGSVSSNANSKNFKPKLSLVFDLRDQDDRPPPSLLH